MEMIRYAPSFWTWFLTVTAPALMVIVAFIIVILVFVNLHYKNVIFQTLDRMHKHNVLVDNRDRNMFSYMSSVYACLIALILIMSNSAVQDIGVNMLQDDLNVQLENSLHLKEVTLKSVASSLDYSMSTPEIDFVGSGRNADGYRQDFKYTQYSDFGVVSFDPVNNSDKKIDNPKATILANDN